VIVKYLLDYLPVRPRLKHVLKQPPLQRPVQAALDEMVASGAETGLQVAVIRDGQVIADAVAGLADPRTGAQVRPDTLFYAASTAKGIASSLAHALVESGQLDYDLRLAAVWPEFGAHGKDRVTLRHVLLHTAGVPGLPPDTTPAGLADWDRMCAALASQEPWWEPGTRYGYHMWTFGYLLGELIRRATGQTISASLSTILTGPLGIAGDVHFGVPRPLLGRVARQIAAPEDSPALAEPGSPLDRAMPRGVLPDAGYVNRLDFLTADIPSCGTMTARGAARLYSALLGHVAGVRLVSPARLRELAAVAWAGHDEAMGFPAAWAFGYCPDRPGGGPASRGSSFGMIGANGSAAYADIDSGVAVAVMRNRFAVGDLACAERIDQIVFDTLR
jgi:CubicO group peptidase (beta-lactamase class C family)